MTKIIFVFIQSYSEAIIVYEFHVINPLVLVECRDLRTLLALDLCTCQ
jgi:hypothetical protein